jgi:ribonuclease H2 subunit C
LGKKSSHKKSGESSDSWETSATFNDITYWNHDYVPSQNDDFFRAFHWLTVAKAVSSFSLHGLLVLVLFFSNCCK